MAVKPGDFFINQLEKAGGMIWVEVDINTTAEAGYGYMVDASGGFKEISLPLTPEEGDLVGVMDGTGDVSPSNYIQILRNGEPVMSGTAEIIITSPNQSLILVYKNDTDGWRIVTLTASNDDTLDAQYVLTDKTNFDGNLSTADDTVQKALATLDENPKVIRKNLLINGSFNIDQRVVNTNIVGANGVNSYCFDRWIAVAINQGVDFVDYTPYSSYYDSLGHNIFQLNHVDADVNDIYLEQRIEAANIQALPQNATHLTFSFLFGYDPLSTWTDDAVMDGFYRIPNSKDDWTSSVQTIHQFGQINLLPSIPTSRYSWTFLITDDMRNKGLCVGFQASTHSATLPLGSTNVTQIRAGQPMLEAGETFTGFEFISIGEELALCKRYYEVITCESAGVAYSTTAMRSKEQFIHKRTAPSITLSGEQYHNNGWNTPASTSATLGATASTVSFTDTGLTPNNAYLQLFTMEINAEL